MEIKIDLEQITRELDTLKDDQARYKFELKQIEKEIEKRELQLAAFTKQKGVNEMQYKGYTFGFKISTRTAFDQKLFKESHEDLYNQFKTTKEKEDFYFKLV